MPSDEPIRREILDEAQKSNYTVHPRETKMYHDLKQYWWEGMKRDIANYVSRCLTCQQVEIKQQKSAGLLQHIELPEWKRGKDNYGFCGWISSFTFGVRLDLADSRQAN